MSKGQPVTVYEPAGAVAAALRDMWTRLWARLEA
jgi:hypothetical protein